MEELEKIRLPVIKDRGKVTNTLIIPVCFRGFDYLPSAVKKRQIADFMNYEKRHKDLGKAAWSAPKIKGIAKQVCDWCDEFRRYENLFQNCDGFHFPPKRIVEEWLGEVSGPSVRLPGR